MSIPKLDTTQRIQHLLTSLPKRHPKDRNPPFFIDISFKKYQTNNSSPIQKKLFHQTVGRLIRKQRQTVKRSWKNSTRQISNRQAQLNLSHYISKKENNKITHLNQTSKISHSQLRNPQPIKQIILERKYNTKMAYQYQQIIQAKKIEDQKQTTKNKNRETSQSPLCRNLVLITRSDRKTAGYSTVINNFVENEHSNGKKWQRDQNICLNLLKNEKIRQALQGKENQSFPVKMSSQNQLKRYSSSAYLSSVKPINNSHNG